MRDRVDCCERCLRPWSMCERDPWHPDQCTYCSTRLTESELLAMEVYFNQEAKNDRIQRTA